MTRETKVGLLVGMGVILLVGIIVTDYLAVKTTPEGLSPIIDDTTTQQIAPPDFGRPSTWEHATDPEPQPGAQNVLTFAHDMKPAFIENDTVVGDNALAEPPMPQPGPDDRVRVSVGETLGTDQGMDFGGTANPNEQLAPVESVSTAQAVHYVKENDTLWSLAQRYYGDGSLYPLIADANADKIVGGHRLRTGVQLVIPARPEEANGQPTTLAAGNTTPKPQPRPTSSSGKKVTVQKGDTLAVIAARHLGDSSRWQEILTLNRDVLKNEHSLQPGMVLKLPAAGSPRNAAETRAVRNEPARTSNANRGGTTKYTTREGDTLWKIAQVQLGDGSRYDEIYKANRKVLPNPRSVPVDVVLTLPKR